MPPEGGDLIFDHPHNADERMIIWRKRKYPAAVPQRAGWTASRDLGGYSLSTIATARK